MVYKYILLQTVTINHTIDMFQHFINLKNTSESTTKLYGLQLRIGARKHTFDAWPGTYETYLVG